MTHPTQVANFNLYKQAAPERDERYKRFIRQLPCVACGTRYGIEAAHVGAHGMGQKASDYQTVPLCKACHRELHRSKRLTFEAKYGVDFQGLMEMFQSFYARKLAR